MKKLVFMCVVLVLTGSVSYGGIIDDALAAWYFGDDSGTDVSGNGATYSLRNASVGGGKVNISGDACLDLGSVAGTLTGGGTWTVYLQNVNIGDVGEWRVLVDIGEDDRKKSVTLFDRGGLVTDIWYESQFDVGGNPGGSDQDVFVTYDNSFHVYQNGSNIGNGGHNYGGFVTGGSAAIGTFGSQFPIRQDDMGYNAMNIQAEGVAVWDKVLSGEEMTAASGAIPEPATLALLGIGGLLLRRKR
jgi:hypothetical protein